MTRAVVIGAGVSGLATAIALRQTGIEAQVYEAYPDPTRDQGTFVSLAANGGTMLRHLDCLDRVLVDGFPVPEITMWSGRGKRLGTLPFAGSEYLRPAGVTIKRGKLVGALLEQARRNGVAVHTGKQLGGYRQDPSGEVTAVFADGTAATGTILIGADGIHSRLRELIDPAAATPAYAGLVGVGGYADPSPALDRDVAPNMFNMVFGTKAFFGYVREPQGSIWWFANLPRRDEPSPAELAAVTSEQWCRQLIDTFAADATPAARIIAGTSHALRPHASHLMPPVATWHRGAAIIVGDAAHCASPSSGQGASLALEDAVALATCLRDQADVGNALVAYEHLRRERAQRVVRHGARGNRSKTLGPVGRRLAEALMPIALRYLARSKSLRWQYTYDIDPAINRMTADKAS
jgi:2-polyprenyl-6-methoxyphenol hydroxylase-like FAD-dependent oxidoreductase